MAIYVPSIPRSTTIRGKQTLQIINGPSAKTRRHIVILIIIVITTVIIIISCSISSPISLSASLASPFFLNLSLGSSQLAVQTRQILTGHEGHRSLAIRILLILRCSFLLTPSPSVSAMYSHNQLVRHAPRATRQWRDSLCTQRPRTSVLGHPLIALRRRHCSSAQSLVWSSKDCEMVTCWSPAFRPAPSSRARR